MSSAGFAVTAHPDQAVRLIVCGLLGLAAGTALLIAGWTLRRERLRTEPPLRVG